MSGILPKTKCLRKRVSASIPPFSRFQSVGKPTRFQVFKVSILKVNHLRNNTIEPNQTHHKIFKPTHMIGLLCSFASRKYDISCFFWMKFPRFRTTSWPRLGTGRISFRNWIWRQSSKQLPQRICTLLTLIDWHRWLTMGQGWKNHDNCQKNPFSFKCFMNWDLGVVWETKSWNVAYCRNSPRKHIRTRSFYVLTTFTLIGNPFNIININFTQILFDLLMFIFQSSNPWACGVSHPRRADPCGKTRTWVNAEDRMHYMCSGYPSFEEHRPWTQIKAFRGPRRRFLAESGLLKFSAKQHLLYRICMNLCLCMKILFEDLCVKCEAFSYPLICLRWLFRKVQNTSKYQGKTPLETRFIVWAIFREPFFGICIFPMVTLAAVPGREAEVVSSALSKVTLRLNATSQNLLLRNPTQCQNARSTCSPNIFLEDLWMATIVMILWMVL